MATKVFGLGMSITTFSKQKTERRVAHVLRDESLKTGWVQELFRIKALNWLLVGVLTMTVAGLPSIGAQPTRIVTPPSSLSKLPAPDEPPANVRQEMTPMGPAKDDYRIGEKDVLEIHIFGQSQTDQPTLYTVSPSGTIHFAYIGDVLVSGKTVNEIHNVLMKKLGDGYIVDPQLSVGVKEYNSQSVSVLGEISRPGIVPLKGQTTLLEVLSQAGLTKTTGGQATIARLEGGQNKVLNVKLADIFSNNFDKLNIFVQNGDIINVTSVEGSRFYVEGEVAKPGPYDADEGMTVLKAIAVAGGFSKFANKKVLIKGSKGERKAAREVDVGKIERGKAPDVPIKGGDIIVVPKRFF